MFGNQFVGAGKIMSPVIRICFLIALLSCGDKNKSAALETLSNNVLPEVENFDWLLGSWKRTNEVTDKETFEIWKKNNNTEYTGLGFTMQYEDTVFQEKIKLIKRDNKWYFEVSGPEEAKVTIFKMTDYTELEFTCENLQNPFPKYIKYWKNNNNLSALIYDGDTMELSFEFEKKH